MKSMKTHRAHKYLVIGERANYWVQWMETCHTHVYIFRYMRHQNVA